MRIVLVTPLYPPDTAPPALYIKELARRLSSAHDVTVLAYTSIPEAIPGVRIHAIQKRNPMVVRLLMFTWSFFKVTHTADVVCALNGASVELPLRIVLPYRHTPFVFIPIDTIGYTRVEKSPFLRRIHSWLLERARHTEHVIPGERPEILPFEPRPIDALTAYEKEWSAHIEKLQKTFPYGT